VIAIKNQRPQLRPRVEAILEAISEVCLEHLDEEYAVLSARLIGKLARKRPSPLLRGQPRIWAAGAIYTVAVNNFLFDAAQTLHMRAADLSKLVGVPQATMYNKTNQIRTLLGLRSPLDPEFCRQDDRRPPDSLARAGRRSHRRRPHPATRPPARGASARAHSQRDPAVGSPATAHRSRRQATVIQPGPSTSARVRLTRLPALDDLQRRILGIPEIREHLQGPEAAR
jgi:hypothetical protein